jgi:hypothetical protein
MLAFSKEDIGAIVLISAVIFMVDNSGVFGNAPADVDRQRKKRQIKNGSFSNPATLKNKLVVLESRGIAPPRNLDDPADFEAQVDQLLEQSRKQSKLYDKTNIIKTLSIPRDTPHLRQKLAGYTLMVRHSIDKPRNMPKPPMRDE